MDERYRLTIDGGTDKAFTKEYTKEELESKKDYIDQTYGGRYKVETIGDADTSAIDDAASYTVSFDGSDFTKTYTGAQFKEKKDYLDQNYGGRYHVTSTLGSYDNMEDLFGVTPSAKEQLDTFRMENRDFMNDFEERQGVADKFMMLNNGVAMEGGPTQEERQHYNQLAAEEDVLKRAYYTSDEYLRAQGEKTYMLSQMQKQLQADIDLYASENPMIIGGAAFVPNPAVSTSRGLQEDEEMRNYDTARRILNETVKLHNAPSKYDASTGIRNMAVGAGDELTNAALWTSGLSEIADNLNVRGVLTKVQKELGSLSDLSEEKIESILTPAEKAVLQAWAINAQTQIERAADLSRGYQAGKGAVESLGFMAEFALTGGVGKATAEGAETFAKWLGKKLFSASDEIAGKMAKEVAEEVGEGIIKKYAKNLGLSLAEAAGRTGVMPSTFRNISEKALEIEKGEDGELRLIGMNRAFVKGLSDSFIENLSEGGRVNALGGLVGDTLNKIPKWNQFTDWLSHTKVGNLYTALNSSGIMNTLRAGGWHGIGEEYLEEWYGNAIRTITGVDKDALREFATKDNQMITIASFLPLTIFGGTVSTAQVLSAKKKLDQSSQAWMSALQERAYSDKQAKQSLDMLMMSSPAEIGKIIDSLVAKEAETNLAAAVKLSRAGADLMKSVIKWQAFNTKYKAQEADQRTAVRDRLSQAMPGKKWWMTDEKGKETVMRATNADGDVIFVTGKPSAPGQKSAGVRADGEVVFFNADDYQMEDEVSMDVFLGNEVMAEKADKEKARMLAEKDAAIAEIKKNAVPGASVVIGTVEAPIPGTIVKRYVDGVAIETADGVVMMTYEQLGNYVGVNANPLTDEQLDEQESDVILAEEAQREAELDGEYIELTGIPLEEEQHSEEAVENAQAALDIEESLPVDAEGNVDEQALWNEDPTKWAAWNDEQRQDGGANSMLAVNAAISSLSAQIAEAEAAYAALPVGPERNAMEQDINAKKGRLQRLNDIAQSYAVQAEAAAAEQQIQASATSQMSEQQKEQIDAQYESIYGQTRSLNERARLLQEYLDKISEGSIPVVVLTKSNYADAMKKAGCSQGLINAVAAQMATLAPGDFISGFNAGGKVFVMVEGLPSADYARKTYVHERQHGFNTRNMSFARRIASAMSRQQMLDFIETYAAEAVEIYKRLTPVELADELICRAMESVYTYEDFSVDLQSRGLPTEAITIINEINDEQRNDINLANSRRGRRRIENADAFAAGSVPQNGRDSEQVSRGILEQEATGSPKYSARGAGDREGGEGAEVDENGVTAQQNEEINKAVGGELEIGDESAPIRMSATAIAEGVGLELIKDDGEGNVAIVLPDGRIANANHLLTPEDIKDLPDSVLSYMMKDAKSLGMVGPAKEWMLWNKYTMMLNAILVKGSAENGGFEYLSSQWQWIAESIYKTVALNADSQYSYSLDITRVCKKNEAVITAIAEMQRRLGYGITPAQIMDIYLATEEAGYQVPCPVCYVFSRYIRNGKFATIMINGQRKYGDKLVDPRTLTEKEKQKRIQYWLAEKERLEAENEANKQAISKANEDIIVLMKKIDDLAQVLTDPRSTLTDEQKAEIRQQILDMDSRYKAALNVISQASLDSWITQFAIHEVTVDGKKRWELWDDTYMGFPEEMALDLRETATVMREFPAIQRFRNSRGSPAGKEITFASNNDLGDVPMALGSQSGTKDLAKPRDISDEEWEQMQEDEYAELKTGAQNLYKKAAKEKNPTKKRALLKAAKKRFTAASIYAKQQTLRGGQRMWSWSDNIERLAPDVFVNLLQMEMLGGALQAYSKQLEGIKLVAAMNGYINGSLMGKGNGYKEVSAEQVEEADGKLYLKDGDFIVAEPGKKPFILKTPVYLNSDGKYYVLEFDDVVGVDPYGKTAEDGHHLKGLFELNQEYDRAGNILVGMNDIHVRIAMADDRIFFIIPWHSSGANTHILAQMYEYLGVEYDVNLSQDYTDVQGEKRYKAEGEKEEDEDSADETSAEDAAEEAGEPGKKKKKKESAKITEHVVAFWNDHYENAREIPGYGKVAGKDFRCGIKGGIESSNGNGYISASQAHYRELRDAIFVGVKVDTGRKTKKGKPIYKTLTVEEYSQEWFNEIMNDEFLSQVYAKVREAVGEKGFMTSKDCKAIYPYEYWDETSTYGTADINGVRYLEYCRRLGYKPKFCGKLDGKPENDYGNFTDDRGYWKVLIDRRMYGLAGAYQGLTPVTAENFTPDLVDPEKTKEEFVVTKVADEKGTQEIVDAALAKEEGRPGGQSYVDYDLTLSEAAGIYEGKRQQKPKAAKAAKPKSQPKAKKAKAIAETKDIIEAAKASLEEGEEKLRYSVIGEVGALRDKTKEGMARLENLEVARQMEQKLNPDWNAKENEAALKIKVATGWERGVDGLWRYEVEDIKAKPIEDWIHSKKKLTLGDIVEDGEVMRLYPEFADITIVKGTSKYDWGAVYDNDEKKIKLPFGALKYWMEAVEKFGSKYQAKLDEVKAVMLQDILHEVQHAIQHAEAFAVGGNEDLVVDKEARRAMQETYDEASAKVDEYNSMDYFERISSYGTSLRREAERLKMKYKDIWIQNKLGRLGYHRLAGETEARNIPARMHMPMEERRRTLLAATEDVSREDQQILLESFFDESAESEVRFSAANESQAIFVSNAAKAVEAIKMEKATPAQWLAMIEKNGGLKAGEDKWIGLSDWLKASDKKTLTKAEVLDFIGEHMIQIEETHYDAYAEEKVADAYAEMGRILQDKFNAYRQEYYEQNEGEDLYGNPANDYAIERLREEFGDEFPYAIEVTGAGDVYFTFPYEEDEDMRKWSDKLGVEYNPQAQIGDIRLRYTTDGLTNKREIALTVPTIEPWGENDMTHFGDAGEGRAVAWIRFGETTDEAGNRVLVIDEIQSKRHQEGREKGYATMTQEEYTAQMNEKYGTQYFGWQDKATPEEWETYRSLAKAIPAAPFEKNWHELAMKRMLRYAAENGYDYIAWTKGDQQAERYGLGGVVEDIYRAENIYSDSRYIDINLPSSIIHLAVDEDGMVVQELNGDGQELSNSVYVDKQLSEIVGREVAEKVMEMEEGDTLAPEDLKVSNEGMKGFYDKMLPAFMNKYGKKWGVKVSDMEFPNLEDGLTMHSIPVTEEMKESVMEGQVMFSAIAPHQSSLTEVTDMFHQWNKEEDLVPLMEKALKVAEQFGVQVRFASDEEMSGIFGQAWSTKVRFNADIFNWADEQDKARCILHELIHSASEYVMSADEADLLENQIEARREIEAIYEEVKSKFSKEYGAKSAIEMVAEMANPRFRAMLKEGTAWERFVNAIRRILGLEEKDYDRLTPTLDALERILETPDTWLKDVMTPTSEEYLRFSAVSITPEVREEMDRIAANAIIDGNYMLAPNGQPTKLTADQWAMVRTKNFINWFGDWINDPENASKVVDENGEPRVIYHGSRTGANITEFVTPSFFSDDFATADMFKREAETILSINGEKLILGDRDADWLIETITGGGYELNTIYGWGNLGRIIDDASEEEREDIESALFNIGVEVSLAEIEDMRFLPVPDVYQCFVNMRNPVEIDFEGKTWGDKGTVEIEEKARSAKERGYDGVIVKNIREGGWNGELRNGEEPPISTDYIPAFPNQIKSATETTGEFSESGDIRFSANFANPMDSQGNTLSPEQREFFANSKAVDKEGNLLALYHGTPRAGFTEFKSGWFTTSKEDAISYSGDRKGRMFDPNEEYVPETLTAGDFRLGYMTFDSEEDRTAFLERFPASETAMSEHDFEIARMGAEDAEYDALTARRGELKQIWDAYREYERDRFVDTTVGEILESPNAYTEDDLRRAMLAYDSNVVFDSIDEIEDAQERKDALISALNNANEETEGGILDLNVETRVPRNGEGIKHNDLGRRTYEVYANLENPYEIDAAGRHSEFESGDIYEAVREALANEEYDGVIIRNWRVGRYQQLGDVVVPKRGDQIKLTSNITPSESEDVRFSATTDSNEASGTRFSVRTNPAPVKTQPVYKLMRLGADGRLYPLFIGSAEAIELGVWYDADSPNLGDLTRLATGVHIVNNETGEAMTLEEFKAQHPEIEITGKRPNVDAINWATANGMRWIEIEDKAKGQKRYGGEARSYFNLGINGSGQVGQFAMRPGWHAGSLPTMRQIGKGTDKYLRDDSFVWVKGRVPADIDYQAEADANPDKDIPTHIPTDGYYMKATNANAAASQADRVGWYVAGSFIADEIISDEEARRVITEWNEEHPDTQVKYDFRRESGMDYVPGAGMVEATLAPAKKAEDVVAEGLNLTDQEFARLAGDIFAALPKKWRKEVTDNLTDILGLQKDMMQIVTRLAEKENWSEREKELAKDIRNILMDILDPSGIDIDRPLTTKEALWMLYNALEKEADMISEAKRSVVAHNLGFDIDTLAKEAEAKDEVRFSARRNARAEATARMYNKAATNVWTRLKETFVDMFAAVEDLVKAIEKASGKVAEGFENIILALNQQSSRGFAAMEKYEQEYLDTMFDEIDAIMNSTGMTYDEVVRYVILKHGLERNEEFAKRDAREFYEDEFRQKVASIRANESLTEQQKKAQEAQAERELDQHLTDINWGIDAKYKELREKDYSGITSMFYDQLDVKREDYETEEDYQSAIVRARRHKYDTLADVEAAAANEVRRFEGMVNTDNLWKAINASTKEILRQQYEASMISKESYDKLKDMFKYYVPLRGFKDNTAEDMYTYYQSPNSTGYTKPILAAEGRSTEAESPFGWIASMASSAIASNVKNEARLALYYFVVNRPDNGLATVSKTWYVHEPGDVTPDGKKIFRPSYPPLTPDMTAQEAKDATARWMQEMEAARAQGNAYESGKKLNLGDSVVNVSESSIPEHAVKVKVGGKDYVIFINGNPRAAQAINGNLNIETSEDYSKVFGKVLRWMSSVNTSYNPEFWVTNMQRDMLFTLMAINTKEDPEYRRKFASNYAKAFKVIKMAAQNEEGTLGDAYLEEMYRQFVENGGVTGYTQIKDNEIWEQEIADYMKSKDKERQKMGMAMKKAKDGLHKVHRFGESLEQVSRFAAFLTSREMGRSMAESISDAKEITVNFNRKGSGRWISPSEARTLTDKNGQPLNGFERFLVSAISSISPIGRRSIMFFNAAIQGLNATYKLYKANPAKMIGIWSLGYMSVGVMNALLHNLMDDDDDYLDMPQYERRGSLMLGADGFYFKWAIPQEAKMFYALGDIFVEQALGRNPQKWYDEGSALREAVRAVTEVLPVNPLEGWRGMLPSVLVPVAELIVNEDYKGQPIYRESKWMDEEETKRTARWSRAYEGTGLAYVGISQLLNNLTGGDARDAGIINIPPEAMEHIVQSSFGGTIRTMDKFVTTVIAALDQEVSEKDEPLTMRQAPFLNRLFVLNDERFKNVHVNQVYDFYKAEAEHAKKLEKGYKEDRNIDKLLDLRISKEYRWARIYERYEKPIEKKQEQVYEARSGEERKRLQNELDALKKRMIREMSQQ